MDFIPIQSIIISITKGKNTVKINLKLSRNKIDLYFIILFYKIYFWLKVREVINEVNHKIEVVGY